MSHDSNTPHHHSEESSMTFAEKSAKRLAHWIQHNDDHAQNYRQWAEEFNQHQLPQVAALLESAADLTAQLNQILNEALHQLPTSIRH